MNGNRIRSVVLAGALAALPFFALPGFAAEIEAITKPSADVALSFVRGGRILEVLVKEGDVVKRGALLARQEDEAELIQLRQLTTLADDTTKIEGAEADLAQKRADLKRFEWARGEGAATDWEYEHERLNVRNAELALTLARFEQEQNRLKRDELKAQLDRLHLFSPIAGLVEEVTIEPGESAQPLDPVIRVVDIDPLWIDIPVPLAQARKFRKGQEVRVELPSSSSGKPARGRIINVSAVADAASDTLRVRVEMPNPSGRPAGEQVKVSF